jgi:precorrin-8X/cobalt-precorrin-8 methylmutase
MSPLPTLLARYGLPPAEIERRSLAYVREQVGDRLSADPAARAVATRIIYAAGDLSLADEIHVHPLLPSRTIAALRARRPIVVDVRMVAVAIENGPISRLGCPLHVAVNVPGAAEQARSRGWTRTAVGLAMLAPYWADGIVVVGTAPTALLALLDLVAAGASPPAAVIATPVGFVAAAESKEALVASALPHVTVTGTRGGAAMAAAALNALGQLALE